MPILRKVFHYFQAHVSKNLRKYNDSLTKCNKTIRNLVFFMVSELRKLEDALGPLGSPKILKSITFSIESLKEFGIRRPGPEICLECYRTARKPKSLQIDYFLNRNLKEFGTFSDWLISLHFLVVDAMHAIDAQSVEQYSLVKVFLDVSYWSGLLLG